MYQILQSPVSCKVGNPGDIGGFLPSAVGVLFLEIGTNEKMFMFFDEDKKEYCVARWVMRKLSGTSWTTTPVSWVEVFDIDTAPGQLVTLLNQQNLMEEISNLSRLSEPRVCPH